MYKKQSSIYEIIMSESTATKESNEVATRSSSYADCDGEGDNQGHDSSSLTIAATATAQDNDANNDDVVCNVNESKSVAYKDLPPIPIINNTESSSRQQNENNNNGNAILLFYQYVEPFWTKMEHTKAIKKVIEIGTRYDITGRGRIAQEGLNCTLTGTSTNIRTFCYELRNWLPTIFNQTDFKITDNIHTSKIFKSLSIRKCNELVAYGLNGEHKAPSISKFGGTHLNAIEYHKAIQDNNTVIIDVRNAYETEIGTFQPPKNGATLLNPKMRNSIEFPKWLSQESTQKQLHNKKVLM